MNRTILLFCGGKNFIARTKAINTLEKTFKTIVLPVSDLHKIKRAKRFENNPAQALINEIKGGAQWQK